MSTMTPVIEVTPVTCVRLDGYVKNWNPDRFFGFISVKGMRDVDGRTKQFHFHRRNLRRGVSLKSITPGMTVRFTPVAIGEAGLRDKATDIEVLG